MGTFRFLLALSVALSHFGTVWGYHILNARMAVQCFYMISGFLIALVLSRKYDGNTADGRWLFYSNRALRIFVPYWSFCLLILLMHALVYVTLGTRYGVDAAYAEHWSEMTLPTRLYLVLSNTFIVAQEWSMWLAYQGGAIVPVWNSDFASPHMSSFQIIPQAWSVSLELMFYALAPFLVRRHWVTLLAVIVATYLLRSLAQAYGFTGSGFVYRLFPIEIGLFLAGVLSYRVYAYVSARSETRFSVSLAISAALLAIVLVQQFIDSLDNHKFYILVVVALPALFDVSRRLRWDGWLGDLSYPIYLCHLAVMSFGEIVVGAVLGPIQDRSWLVLAMTAATVLLSIAYVHSIDAPFERWRQRRATHAKPRRALAPLPQPEPMAVSA